MLIRLPARLRVEFDDHDSAVTITQITRAGFCGAGRVLDPLVRLIFTRSFAADLEEHVRTEFPLLRELLQQQPSGLGRRRGYEPPPEIGRVSTAAGSIA